ncbi:MAG: MTH1187 family thiamine-binding protein [Deltaproteobacteria bacterium]|nr:MTH1187 family thiamine-binding protein [Deltaproteobacteria bacterium]
MAILDISIVPLGTEGPSLSSYLRDLPAILEDSGLRYQIHPMGSVVEGGLEELFALTLRLHEAPFSRGCRRVATHLLIDDRRDLSRSMEDKAASLIQAAENR